MFIFKMSGPVSLPEVSWHLHKLELQPNPFPRSDPLCPLNQRSVDSRNGQSPAIDNFYYKTQQKWGYWNEGSNCKSHVDLDL